jgi:hypothetical protein
MSDLPDVDIDFSDRQKAIDLIDCTPAMMKEHGVLTKHNTGVYYTDVPYDPVTGVATLDYKTAEDRGYFKLDLLNVAVYRNVKDEAHLDRLMAQEPQWNLLWESKEFCEKVIHISNYYDLIVKKKPTSIPQMAMLLSIIRPGKANLQYKPWNQIAETVWQKPADGSYYFKKAHAVAYAHLVAVHINLLSEEYK